MQSVVLAVVPRDQGEKETEQGTERGEPNPSGCERCQQDPCLCARALPYPVYCSWKPGDFFKEIGAQRWRQVVVIADSTTGELFGDQVVAGVEPLTERVLLLRFPAGEEHKTRETKAWLEDQMLEAGIERGCCVVGLGGGVALDLAGFVASTFLRGVPSVLIATSLLAQVDASIGGKTAVNTPCGKNLIGAFHNPQAVLLATQWLSSLPSRELRSGLAECLKHAVLAAPALLEEIDRYAEAPTAACLQALVLRSVRVKAEVVTRDEREQGLRLALNFGHTVGHALESVSHYALSHGEAVALGMAIEAAAAQELVSMPSSDVSSIVETIRKLELWTPPPCCFEQLGDYLVRDKKTSRGEVHCSLVERIGALADYRSTYRTVAVPLSLLQKAWAQVVG